jgi:hypothetical protein
MAARKKVTKSRATKKPTRKSAAPKRAPAAKAKTMKPKVKAKAKPKTSVKSTAKPKAKLKTQASSATPAATKSTKVKATPAPRAAIPRRDATGHLNPTYAADLRARSRASAQDLGNDNAFLRKSRAHDSLAEELGEEAVATMTSGEDQSERMQDLEVEEDSGGPFITTSGREEFARGTDKSNPFDATREPFPTT